jgi:hypothetical protein
MSAAPKSIADLAADACAMPWEDRAPFNARYAFREAVTPELFTELLQAAKAVAFSNGFDAALPDKMEALRAVIAKAGGAA